MEKKRKILITYDKVDVKYLLDKVAEIIRNKNEKGCDCHKLYGWNTHSESCKIKS